MDQTHVHLIITHLPIFGTLLGAFVLVHGIWTDSHPTRIAAYNVFLVSALAAAIAYATGEAAEETAEGIAGVSEAAIEAHEESAGLTLGLVITLGVLSVAGLWVTVKKSLLAKPVAIIVLAFSLVVFGFSARTGNLGGKIRHTEINTGATVTTGTNGQEVPASADGYEEDEEDDD